MLDLEAIKKRVGGATPSPWRLDLDSGNICDACGDMVVDSNYGHYAGGRTNLIFISHSREDIPALIAEVERLRDKSEAVVLAFSQRPALEVWAKHLEQSIKELSEAIK